MAPVEAHFERPDRLINWKTNSETVKRGRYKRISFPDMHQKMADIFVFCDGNDNYGKVKTMTASHQVRGFFYEGLEPDEEGRAIDLTIDEPVKFSGTQRVEIVRDRESEQEPDVKLVLRHIVPQTAGEPLVSVKQVVAQVYHKIPTEPRVPALMTSK